MYGTGRDATRRRTRLRGTTAWARGSDAFRRWTDTFVSAGAAVRRGAPSIGRPMTQFPCLVSAAPRVDAKALWIIFCGAGDAPSNDSGSPPLGLRVSDVRAAKASGPPEEASMMRGCMRRMRKGRGVAGRRVAVPFRGRTCETSASGGDTRKEQTGVNFVRAVTEQNCCAAAPST